MRTVFIEKNWYTLNEAVDRLASRFTEFNQSDLLQLALEGRTALSVVFSDQVPADEYKKIREEDLKYDEIPTLSGKSTLRIPVGGDVVYDMHNQPHQKTERSFLLRAGEAHKLAMIGGEVADLHDRLWKHFRKPREETLNLDGTFCFAEMEEAGEEYSSLFRLMEPFGGDQAGYYPMGRLPGSAMLVVEHDVLVELLNGKQSAHSTANGSVPAHEAQGWPWGAHGTKLLSHLEAAARRFWVNFDPSDSSTAPTNDQVSSWLQAQGVSQRNADVMATILRADGLPTGPRKG